MNNLFKNNLTDCNLSSLSIHSTGYIKLPKNNNNNTQKIDSSKTKIRIVFLFTLNGRSIRQIIRLFNTLYNESHYYYFHVDQVIFKFVVVINYFLNNYFNFINEKRREFLKKEVKKLNHLKNVHISDWSMSTIWGGASLLEMHLKVMKELIDFKWNWDYIINLSESDYPIK